MFNDKRLLYFLISLIVIPLAAPIAVFIYKFAFPSEMIIYTLLATPFIVGLIRTNVWAINAISSIIIVLCIFVPIGAINPYAAMDMINPPPVEKLAVKVYSFVAIGLIYVYLLNKFKHFFHKRLL